MVRRSPKRLEAEAPQDRSCRYCCRSGAAYYGRVRHGTGLRIRAGCGRTYYIGLLDRRLQAICVLPAGTEEGTAFPLLNRDFSVLANRPVSFTLYSSRTGHERHGEVAALDGVNLHRHAPLVTLLRYGKRLREFGKFLRIYLRASFTRYCVLEVQPVESFSAYAPY